MNILAAKDLPCVSDRCRTCMIKLLTGITAVNIFERTIQNMTIAEILHTITVLTFDANDEFPKAVCQLCYEKLTSFYQFLLHIENVDIKFKAELQANDHNILSSKDIMKNNLNFVEMPVDNLLQENKGATIKEETYKDNFTFGTDGIVEGFSDINIELINNFAPKCETVNVYMCKICSKCFSNKRNYQWHIKKHSNHSQHLKEYMFTAPSCVVNNSISQQQPYQDSSESSTIDKNFYPIENIINSDNEQADSDMRLNFQNDPSETTDKKGVCDICNRQFKNNHSMAAHMKKHVAIGRVLSCSTCGKVFRKLSHLKRHQMFSLNRKRKRTKCQTMCAMTDNANNVSSLDIKCENTCEICRQTFETDFAKSLHMRTHFQKGRVLSQSSSGKVVKKIIELKQHDDLFLNNLNEISGNCEIENTNHNLDGTKEGDNPCKICKMIFKSKNSLAAHLRKHTERQRVLSCSKCGKVFKKVSHVKRHELTHEEKVYKCSLCNKSYSTKQLLRQHLTQHNEAKECPMCKKKFASKATLNAHMKSHNRIKLNLCSYCGKKFDTSSNLKQHYQRHTGIKNWACSLCPKKFVSKGELTSHSSTHTGLKPYKCKLCNTAFTKGSSLVIHMKRHQGIKPYQCDTCHKKFATNYSLKTHYRIHTGEKPYVCDICTQAFTQNNDLIKHRRRHLGEKLFKCDHCPESFRLKTELMHHTTQHYAAKLQADMATERTDKMENVLDT